MRLTVVGCASGFPSPDKAHSCYLIESGGKICMLDCGGGAASALHRLSVETERISGVFISHTHADHFSGLPLFIQMEHLKRREEPLDIHVPSEAAELTRGILVGMYLLPDRLSFQVSVRGLEDGSEIDCCDLTVKSIENSHLRSLDGAAEIIAKSNYANQMQCFSFVVRAGSKKLLYSADIAGTGDIADHLTGCDLLVIEGMHIDLEGLPTFLLEKNVENCVLTHLPDGFDCGAARVLFEKLGYTGLSFAEEGMVIEI